MNTLPRIQKPLKMPFSENGFIPTLNHYGYMLNTPDPYSSMFIEHAGKASGFVLDIGAAYGVATLPALEKGAHVIASDLDERHLKILWERTSLSLRPRLIMKAGIFPTEVSFPPFAFEAVLASGVLHYLSGEELEKAFKAIFASLKHKGKFFFFTSTPYIGLFKEFLPLYYEKKRQNDKWPGLITDSWMYAPHRKSDLPKRINLLDEDILERLFLEIGFTIEKKSYVSMSDYPSDIQSDGKEYIGFIGKKP